MTRTRKILSCVNKLSAPDLELPAVVTMAAVVVAVVVTMSAVVVTVKMALPELLPLLEQTFDENQATETPVQNLDIPYTVTPSEELA